MVITKTRLCVCFFALMGALSLSACGDDAGNGGPSCGNGEIEGTEECDGADLGGETCSSLGLEDGELGCTSDCEFDTSGCQGDAVCGDSTRQYPEECDDSDLAGEDCVSLGFDGGTLACASDCTFDTSGCSSQTECGNSIREATEECDGDDLAGETCASLGEGSGSLDCTDSCTFDTSGCTGPESIFVTSPNGGEVLTALEDHNISWTSTNTTGTVDIAYSINGGTTWLPVATEQTDNGLYTWSVPNTPSTDCLVRVRKTAGSPSDISDAVFEIAPPADSSIWYVDADATGNEDGTSWADAFTEIQDAVAAVTPGDEIWVAEGSYFVRSGEPFVLMMKENLVVLGGFNGTETERSSRDPETHITTLHGNGSAHHVVVGASSAMLSGFHITGGAANDSSPDDSGGGMLNDGVTGLLVDGCVFHENEAAAQGGGMHNNNSTLTVTNCTFDTNTAGNGGGAMSNENSDPYILQTSFFDNAEEGGGFAGALTTAQGAPVVESCLFTGNLGYNGGAIYADSGTLSLINTVFYDNYAEVFGGVMLNGGAEVEILNCTLTRNVGNMYGGAISSFGGTYFIFNSILWGNDAPLGKEIHSGATTATVSYSNIDQSGGYIDGGGNFSGHPNFQDPSSNDFSLGQGSPCIDAGDGDKAPATDKDGQPRSDDPTIPNTGSGSPTYTDVGAYEFTGTSSLLLTSPNGGESWTAGDTETITWIASGVTNVKIEVSRDHGVTWSEVVDSTPAASGSYSWTVSGPGSSKGLIRVSDAADSSVWDLSNINFWILSNSVIYVDVVASGNADGTSWTDAFTVISDALAGASFGDEVWVAKGDYTPNGDPQVLILAAGIKFYGGFPAGGGAFVDRDPSLYPTILDGEGLVEHVVVAEDYATLDGFTITGGEANGAWPHGVMGGGMLIDNVSPTISNCTFTGNNADNYGGAVYIVGEGAQPVFSDCVFDGNTAGSGGGCLYFTQSSSPHVTDTLFTNCSSDSFGGAITGSGSSHPFPTISLDNCTFSDNTGGWGGGVSLTNNSPDTSIVGCTFENNTATTAYGGGLYLSNTSAIVNDTVFSFNTAGDSSSGRGGGVSQYGTSDSVFSNCVFVGNSAGGDNLGGGGLFNQGDTSATLINCSFGQNEATGTSSAGGAIYHSDGDLTLTNCILWDDTAPTDNEIHLSSTGTSVITYSNIQGGPSGSDGNISQDPLYTSTGDLHLSASSPCIDAADGDIAPATDIEGNARVDDPSVTNTGTGAIDYADMGAYEFIP